MKIIKNLHKRLSIRQKVNFAIFLEALVIIALSFFIFFSVRLLFSKVRFVELFDNIYISFLEMRKDEKNFFLHHDIQILTKVKQKGNYVLKILNKEQKLLIPILSKKLYDKLISTLNLYLTTLHEIQINPEDKSIKVKLTKLGHILTSFSLKLIKQERKKINKIIHNITIVMFLFIFGIFLAHMITWKYFSTILTKNLIKMKRMVDTVAKGLFYEVAKPTSKSKDNAQDEAQDEITLVIKAISKMANELSKREEELLQAKKLASLGVLISGVAHELGNPLNNISMLSEGFLSYYENLSDNDKKTFVKDIQVQAERIKKIVQNLLDFSRQKKPELKICSCTQLIEKSLNLVKNQFIVSKIRVHKSIQPELPPVLLDENQMQQVLINLFTNAIHAMPQGGDLFIKVFPSNNKDKIFIKIKDTGIGIKPEILPHIFNPFFTTKGTKGTGLGLSVSYGIIKQHNGKISVKSKEGKGTTFTIELPSHKEKKTQ